MRLSSLTVRYQIRVDVQGRYAHAEGSLEAAYEIGPGEGETAESRAAIYSEALQELKVALLSQVKAREAVTPGAWDAQRQRDREGSGA
jgi:hypothetical protein